MNTEKIQLIKPKLEVGVDVACNNIKGKIIKMEGRARANQPDFNKEDYLVVKLDEPDEHNCTILEIRKDSFNYLIYPNGDHLFYFNNLIKTTRP